MRRFNTQNALHWAKKLSFPRLVGTPGEVRARKMVKQGLADLGLIPDETPFRFFPALSFGVLHHLLLLGVALLAAHRILLSTIPWLGGLAGLAIPLIARSLWRSYRVASASKLEDHQSDYPLVGALNPEVGWQFRSGNVIADLPVEGEVRHRLVLSAHTDTKSQNMSIVTRAVCSLLFALGVFALPIATAPALLWSPWLEGNLGGIWWAFWGLAFGGGLVLLTMKVTNESPGALDNAGSCGLLMEMARTLTANPPRGVAVRILLTGGEELGLAGAYHYARHVENEWKDALYLNYEAVGGGQKLWLATGSGPGSQKGSAAQRALDFAEKATLAAGVRPKRLSRMVGAEADHIPLLEAGLAAMTFLFSGPGSAKVHTSADNVALLKEPAMALAGRITLEAVRILEAG